MFAVLAFRARQSVWVSINDISYSFKIIPLPFSWGRRAGRLMIDSSTIVKFILYSCENMSNVFLCVMTVLSMWNTYSYKMQKQVIFFPLTYEQVNNFHMLIKSEIFKESSFIIYIIISAALNAIVLLHSYISLALVETFFIDWERPRYSLEQSRDATMMDMATTTGDGVTPTPQQQKPRKHNPVVIW